MLSGAHSKLAAGLSLLPFLAYESTNIYDKYHRCNNILFYKAMVNA